ncbi:MAG: S8 family peptidase [Candidatus Kapabacteria bacterium]|nr:S8 family peptidase [Candidatus Kapabacteria bacterium]
MFRYLASLIFSIVAVATIPCMAGVEPNTVVIKWRAQAPSLKQWIQAGRHGPVLSITEIIGTHTSEPYILDATLISLARAQSLRQAKSTRASPEPSISRISIIRYEADVDPAMLARKISSLPDVEYAEPLAQQHIIETPNDPQVALQYHLRLIKAFNAWDSLPTDRTVVLGIVDTGIDTTHVDLGANVWHNSGETGLDASNADKRSNKIDDDGNGFVDDWFGWDFVGANGTVADNSPLPGHLHGTHVGGIAAAVVNNGIGVAGVGKNIRVMPVKIARDDPSSISVARTADGILYAASMGASVINCSFGSASFSFADNEVIQQATQLGALIVAAAGNDGVDMAFYPAGYQNVMSVAATDSSDEIAFFSNTHSTVDVCAPGVGIYSTVPRDQYQYLDGTSMASPVAAAVAAMVRLKHPAYSSAETRAAVMAACDNIDEKNGVFLGRYGIGRVNAFRAVSTSDPRWVEVIASSFVDEDGNGFFEPGDKLHLTLTLRNELSALRNAWAKVVPAPAAFSPLIVNDSIIIGPMQHGEVQTLTQDVIIELPADIPFNGELRLLVRVYDSTDVVSRDIATAIVNPTYRTLAVNDITTSVNSTGNIGFNDYPANLQGVGFRYKGGPNLLFEGALMIGVSPRNLPNVARGGYADSKDTSFHPRNVTQIRYDSIPNGARIVTSFSDVYDPYSVGVDVTQNVYALTDDSLRNTVIISLDVVNRVDTTIQDLYVAQFYDFDIGPSGASNGCAWDPKQGIGLVQNTKRPDLPSIGIAMISPLPSNFYAVDNDGDEFGIEIYNNFLRAEKWQTMSAGIRRKNSRIIDVSTSVGAGPLTLAPGERQQICFVVAASEDYKNIASGISAARKVAKDMGLNSAPYTEIPQENKIVYLEGAPLVAPGTREIRFAIQESTPVVIDIIDLFGSTVATVINEPIVPVGTFSRAITIPSMAQGTYFLRMTTYMTPSIFSFGLVR